MKQKQSLLVKRQIKASPLQYNRFLHSIIAISLVHRFDLYVQRRILDSNRKRHRI